MHASRRKAYEIAEAEVLDFFQPAHHARNLTADLDTLPPEFHFLVRIYRNAREAPRPTPLTNYELLKAVTRFHRSIRGELLNVIPEEKALKSLAFLRVHELCLKYKIIHPELNFKLQGKVAGDALKYRVRLNLILFAENPDETLDQTIGHELAHAWRRQLELPGKSHGPQWKQLMRRMGLKPDVYHCMDVERSNQKPKPVFTYTCKCRIRHPLTAREHNELEEARQRRLDAFCKHCGERITYLGKNNMPNSAAKIIVTP
jgi:predicted SprT family Zn-dependent metalloprotease